MPLQDGKYTIYSKVTNYVVGRKSDEDTSLRPKGVFTLDLKVTADHSRTWDITHVDGDKYRLKAGKAAVGAQDGLVYAYLTERDALQAGEWRLQEIFHHGRNNYIITRPNSDVGWIADSDQADGKQVRARTLIVQPSLPPRYPSFEIFIIVPYRDQMRRIACD